MLLTQVLAVERASHTDLPSPVCSDTSSLGEDVVASLAARSLGNNPSVAPTVGELLEHDLDQPSASLALGDVHPWFAASDTTGASSDSSEAAASEPAITTSWTDSQVGDGDLGLDVAPSVANMADGLLSASASLDALVDFLHTLASDPAMNDSVVHQPSLVAAATSQVSTPTTLHPARNDAPSDPTITTASPDHKSRGSLGHHNSATDTAFAGLASAASAETVLARLDSDALASDTTVVDNSENLVSAATATDDASTHTLVHLSRAT